MPVGCRRWPVWRQVLFVWLLTLAGVVCNVSAFAAETVGEVLFVQGITSAQGPGETLRFVNKGDPLHEGDVVSTGDRGFAVISLRDGTKMTLRPNTTFAIDKFRHDAGEESALFGLLRGGMRALTGLISKRNPHGMDVKAATATIGIRGTKFDARLCGEECASEQVRVEKQTAPSSDLIVARVAMLRGTGTIAGPNGETRHLVKGSPLFTGDLVRTGNGAYAVLAFRDQTLVTVVSDSEFQLENVRFDKGAQSGNFLVRVVKGGMRALTGLLAKSRPQAVKFHVLAATVGIRGTGLDTKLAIDCVGSNCTQAAFVFTWSGAVALEVGQQALLIERGRAGVFNPNRPAPTLLDATPKFMLEEPAPRPDTIKVDFNNLFGVHRLDSYAAGLYTGVRESQVEFAGTGGSIDLGPGEAGYLAPGSDIPVRLSEYPSFLLNDRYPPPEDFNEKSMRMLDLFLPAGPGGEICEVR